MIQRYQQGALRSQTGRSEYAKKHMSKHSRVYSAYHLDIGAGGFRPAFVTHRNEVTTAVKRTSRTSECDGREKEEMLKEDLKRNASTTASAETEKLTLIVYLNVNKE